MSRARGSLRCEEAARSGKRTTGMTRSIRVAALQLRAHDLAEFETAFEHALSRVSDAAARNDLLVLPEGTIPAYVLGSNRIDDRVVDAAIDRLAAIAARHAVAIVAGAALRTERGLVNAAVVIDGDGRIAGIAGKLFLWHFDRKWFVPGDTLTPIDTCVGRIGALVCADGRIPTLANALALRGAEILAMPTAWVTSGRDPQHLENVQADLLARVRAYENGVPFVAANKCGTEVGMVAYCGKSQIVDARGNVVRAASEDAEETIEAVVEPAPRRNAMDVLAAPNVRSGSGSNETLRVAISPHALPPDIAERLELLDAAYAIAPDGLDSREDLDRVACVVALRAEAIADPRVLAGHRRSGARVAIVDVRAHSSWTLPLVRARAIELRMYVIVFDRPSERAYAVDPDGVVVAGTFGAYRIASFSLDLHKTTQTLVAPGTDIERGLDLIASL